MSGGGRSEERKRPWRMAMILILCVFAGLTVLMSDVAWAYTSFTCTGTTPNGNILAVESTTAQYKGQSDPSQVGATYTVSTTSVANPCPSNLGIMSSTLCFFKNTVGTTMSAMYCVFQQALLVPIQAAILLVVVIFGVLIATGMISMSVRDAMTHLLKIVLVYAFATNAAYGIGIAYNFFSTVADDGATAAMGALNPPSLATATLGSSAPSAVSINNPDAILTQFFTSMNTPTPTPAGTQSACPGGAPNALCYFNAFLGNEPAGASTTLPMLGANIPPACAKGLAMVFLFMFILVPPFTIFVVMLVLEWIGLFSRALLAYLSAIVLISFLFVLSPLFISFALFSHTRKLFEKWIQYLTTYSIQIIIVFAFLTLLESVPVLPFFRNILGLLKEYDFASSVAFIALPQHLCGICQYQITYPTGAFSGSAADPVAASLGKITCIAASAANAGLPTGQTAPGYVLSADKQNNVIQIWSLLAHQDFIFFMMTQMLALWLVLKVVGEFLARAPDLAQKLGGLPYAAALGGSTPSTVSPVINFIGLESVKAGYVGFRNRFTGDQFNRNILKRFAGSIGAAKTGFLYGADDQKAMGGISARRIQQADLKVDAMRRQYQRAQRMTRQAFDARDAALKEVLRLEAVSATEANQVALATAQHTLKRAQDNFILAEANEPTGKRTLDQAIYERNTFEVGPPQYRGLLGRRELDGEGKRSGRLLSLGALARDMLGHDKDDVAFQEIDRQSERTQQKIAYGHVKSSDFGSRYFFLETPSDLLPRSGVVTLQQKKKMASDRMQDLESQFNSMSDSLSGDRRQALGDNMTKARLGLQGAHSIDDYDTALEQMGAVSKQIGAVSKTATATLDPSAVDDARNQAGAAIDRLMRLVDTGHYQGEQADQARLTAQNARQELQGASSIEELQRIQQRIQQITG